MFDVNTWKLKIRERFKKWEGHWQKAKEAGICTLYGFLCSTALWPIVEASQKGEVAALVALGQVATGIGGGLIGNMIQKWKDETQVARELEDQVGNDPGLRSALDDILERLEVLVQAKDNLNESQWQWFSNTLRTELQKLGNLDRFQCILAGSGAIAGAPHAKAGG